MEILILNLHNWSFKQKVKPFHGLEAYWFRVFSYLGKEKSNVTLW
jgi:hypothetical protein